MLHVELRLTASGPRVIEVNGSAARDSRAVPWHDAGGSGMVAVCGIATTHAAGVGKVPGPAPVRPDQYQLL
ncbi:hypothetical protein [Streptomyces sviceus]|uniref:hypothetical protein n=1 Tax=Streptomyces sviceus TaxID=285530 RepID=UPI00333471F0